MLDHLADCGHVERVRSETDRRVVVIAPDRPGPREDRGQAQGAWRERWEEALEGVDAEELRVASRVLERIGADVRGGLRGGAAEARHGP